MEDFDDLDEEVQFAIRMVPNLGPHLLTPLLQPSLIEDEVEMPDWLEAFGRGRRPGYVMMYELGVYDASRPTIRAMKVLDQLAGYCHDSGFARLEEACEDWRALKSVLNKHGITYSDFGVGVVDDAEDQYNQMLSNISGSPFGEMLDVDIKDR